MFRMGPLPVALEGLVLTRGVLDPVNPHGSQCVFAECSLTDTSWECFWVVSTQRNSFGGHQLAGPLNLVNKHGNTNYQIMIFYQEKWLPFSLYVFPVFLSRIRI